MGTSDVTNRRLPVSQLVRNFDAPAAGTRAHACVQTLYPICRSITGEGLRQTLRLLSDTVPLTVHEVPSGTRVFDWSVPLEWNIRDAYIKNSKGERIVDFRRHNLHVLNYSVPIAATLTLDELRPHLYSAPETPDWIPYRTSYYREAWGFCVSHRQLEAMEPDQYEVRIDSTLAAGSLSYGEYRVNGDTDQEVLISCHSCHPSLANDNLSGMAVAAELARALQGGTLRYSYRFIWAPGTIGAITWLAANEALLPHIRHGVVLSCVGDPGPFTYKRSRRGSAEIDRAIEHVLRSSNQPIEIRDFVPWGYDERQYCSPGINLPVGCFMRTPNGEYPEYHTSADDLSLITPAALSDSLTQLLRVIEVLEGNAVLVNLAPKGEPQLGRRGLYRSTGGIKDAGLREAALLWVLNYSDGEHDLLDIANRSNLAFSEILDAASALQTSGLLAPVTRGS